MESLQEQEARAAQSEPSKKTKSPLLLYGGLGLLVLVVGLVTVGPVSLAIEQWVTNVGHSYEQWFKTQDTGNPLVLVPLAFAGGLLASISPCILALLPVNLSYIGTLKIASRWDAFLKAGAFVLGAVTVLSLFGLFSSFAGLVIVEYKGYINIAVAPSEFGPTYCRTLWGGLHLRFGEFSLCQSCAVCRFGSGGGNRFPNAGDADHGQLCPRLYRHHLLL
jgi:cytochrome c-type biogenesis protein